MKKTFKGVLALAFCIATIFATMVFASAVSAPKVKVKTVSYNTVTLSWGAIKEADGGYEIQRSTNSKKGWKTITTTKKGVTSYKDSKLTTGKTYYYRVRSIDKTLLGKNYSDYSSTIKGTPVPAKVTGVKSSPTHNSVKLTWSKVSGASGYEVQVYSSKKWKSYKTTEKTGLTISKLTIGKTYQYRVRAYKTVSKKKVYGAFSSTIKVTPVLKKPSSFVLKGVTGSSLTLAWSTVDGAKGYKVYNASTKKWIDTKTKRTLTVNNLKAGTKYTFAVRAYSGKYDGPQTTSLSFYTTPAAPSGLKATKVTANSINVTWSKVTGAAGYKIQYSSDAKTWTNLNNTTATAATISKLKSGAAYYIRVRAYVNNSNVKDISATSYGAYSSLTTYTAPAATGSISYTEITASTVTIKWSAVAGATGYEVYNSSTKKWTDAKNVTTYKFTSLKSGTDYTFKVKAYCRTSKSAEKAITVTTTPAKASNIQISEYTSSSFKATWSAVTGADGYTIYIYDYSTKKQTTLTSTTSLSYTFSGLKENSKYKIAVRPYVKNSAGNTYADATWYDNITTFLPTTVYVSWSAVSGATSYKVERFNPETHAWDVILNSTTALSYRDESQKSDTAALYRISAYKNSTLLSSVQKEVSNEGIKISKATNTMTVSWTKPSFESTNENKRVPRFYSVFELPRKGSSETEEKLVGIIGPDVTEHTFFTAYGTEQTYIIYAHNDNLEFAIQTQYINYETRRKQVAKFTVRAEELAINETDTSKTGQLLMLTDAINRTKYEQNYINITRDSTTSFSTDEISIETTKTVGGLLKATCPGLKDFDKSEFFSTKSKFSAKGKDEVLRFMNAMDENTTVKEEEVAKTETRKETVTFNNGSRLSTDGVNELLYTYIEPSDKLPYTAYLYNSNDVSSWKNGFSSVSTKKSNGNYVLTATIKPEEFGTSVNKTQTFYHGGFDSSFGALDISAAEGMSNARTNISATNISAEINSKGQLVSYSFSNTTMTSDYEMIMDGMMDMNLKVSIASAFKYNFTYGIQ